jgi:hypothetical protein
LQLESRRSQVRKYRLNEENWHSRSNRENRSFRFVLKQCKNFDSTLNLVAQASATINRNKFRFPSFWCFPSCFVFFHWNTFWFFVTWFIEQNQQSEEREIHSLASQFTKISIFQNVPKYNFFRHHEQITKESKCPENAPKAIQISTFVWETQKKLPFLHPKKHVPQNQ